MTDDREYFKVETPDDYYQKELDAYSRWQFAWGREIGQNSLDAGAKLIVIKVTESDPIKKNPDSEWTTSTCWVEWDDDGIGMDRPDGEGGIIVFSKFLVLGASMKKDGDTGGFGWAKKLICFAMIEWHIRTGTLHIHGKGGTYWVERNLPRIEGTSMRIRVPDSARRIKSEIFKWLKWTDTKGCQVTLNDDKVPTFADIEVKGTRSIPNIDWAEMTVTEEWGHSIITRANGQMMGRSSGSIDQERVVVIDVIGKSKDYFTSNRDALKGGAKKEISSFLRELFKNPRRISKTDKPIVTSYRGSKGAISIGNDGQASLELDTVLSSPGILLKMLAALNRIGGDSDPDHAMGDYAHEDGILPDCFNVHIHNEMEGHEVPARFVPGTWTKRSIELMAKWCTIIKAVGDIVGYNGQITPGWVFSPGVTAMWKGGCILLNPISIDEMTWAVTDRLSGGPDEWNKLVVSVIHEFVHAFGKDYHDSSFAVEMGRLVALVFDNYDDLSLLQDEFCTVEPVI